MADSERYSSIIIENISKSELVEVDDVYGLAGFVFCLDGMLNKNLITFEKPLMVGSEEAKNVFGAVKEKWGQKEAVFVEMLFDEGDSLILPLERYRIEDQGEWSVMWLWMSVVASTGTIE